MEYKHKNILFYPKDLRTIHDPLSCIIVISQCLYIFILQLLIQIQIFNKIEMKNISFNAEEMHNANNLMNDFISQQYQLLDAQKVAPSVQPGFLRRKLPTTPPQVGKEISELLEDTQKNIMPGIMNWQSPKYFGYFPGSINVTTPMAQMFTSSFHSPGFNFAVAPAYTELQNIMMDWTVQALGLPEKFLLKNVGGGIIANNVTESVMLSINAAKHRAMKRLGIEGNDPRVLKFVGYYSDQCHPGADRALKLKDIYYRRAVPTVYNQKLKNFELDLEGFTEMIQSDERQGLIPLWFGLTYGTTFSAAIQLSQEMTDICKAHNMWISIDAAYLGSTWISEKYRPKKQILQNIDSIAINFLKLLMLSPGGSVFFVANKSEYIESMGGKSEFSFYKNEYSDNYDVVDYKDWTIGLVRRNYAMHFYYLYSHYGIDKLKDAIESLQLKTEYLEELVASRSDLFEVRFKGYSLLSFRLVGNSDKSSNSLTKLLGLAIKNTEDGFSTPSSAKGQEVIRIVIGNFHTQKQHILAYFDKIVAQAQKLVDSNKENL